MPRPDTNVVLELVLEEIAPHPQAAADVQPAQPIHVVHAEGAAGRRGKQRRGRALADPVVRDRVPAVDYLLVGGIEHFERRHHLPRGHGLDLDRSAGELFDAFGDAPEMVLDRLAGWPAALQLEILHRRRLRARALAEERRKRERNGNGNAVLTHDGFPLIVPAIRYAL